MQIDLSCTVKALRQGSALLGRVVGRRCQACLHTLSFDEDGPLCRVCAVRLAPRSGGYCPQCGNCYADPMAPVYPCFSCRTKPPQWTELYFYGPYEGELKDMIHRHKFGCDHGVGSLVTYLVARLIQLRAPAVPDLVIPVPMRPTRLRQRGFNQSVELARIVARLLGRPMRQNALLKLRETSPQSSLGRRGRLDNLKGAFAAQTDLSGKHILLVDDVMTTGATLAACAKACRDAGARCLDAFVLARALRT